MDDLLSAQGLLQERADQVVALLRLDALLNRVGKPIRVGSSALGLMVRRDIDITVVCESLSSETRAAFIQTGAELMSMDRHVVSVRFRNDTGAWNADPDGLYLGVSARIGEGIDWTLDIWAVDRPDRQPDLNHLRTLPPHLDDERRIRILTIKHALAATRPGSSESRIPSAYVYDAVVDDGVGSVKQFAEWLADKKAITSLLSAML
ncbi:hypothetical protein [Methylocapsa aurea]|uniref:hypothetical protein n=1 Tax=Methylocapsa aurea TaxID=663610 RepID=UPI003D189118